MSTSLKTMARLQVDRHPVETAQVLERLSPDAIAAILQETSAESAARVLACFAPALANTCLSHWPEGERSRIVALLPVAFAAALLRQLDPAARQDTLNTLSATVRAALVRVLSYPDQSAGALADPSAPILYSDLTIEEALTRLSQSRGPVVYIFVLDRDQRLLGAVTPGQLLRSSHGTVIESLELSRAHAVPEGTSATTVKTRTSPMTPVAVVDRQNTFVGAIDSDVLARLDSQRQAPPITHLAAAVGEMYWLGLREMLGGLTSGLRPVGSPRETLRANA